jgi:hypothetical protein
MQISNENILARYGALHLELAITREQLEQAKARIVELEATNSEQASWREHLKIKAREAELTEEEWAKRLKAKAREEELDAGNIPPNSEQSVVSRDMLGNPIVY